jgi:hypothetical protein
MDIPAFCDNCGAVFRSGIDADHCINIKFENISVGTCPICGKSGHVPDGVYNFIGDTIEILAAPRRTIDEFTRLITILTEGAKKRDDVEDIARQIRKEVPEISQIADILTRNRNDLYSFIQIILTVVQILFSMRGCDGDKNSITINQTINQVYIETDIRTKIPGVSQVKRNKGVLKPKRNDLCPCGSGVKYKKCCGG